MGVARWGVCPQGLKPRLIFGDFSRHGQGRALTKVTPKLLPYSANLIKFPSSVHLWPLPRLVLLNREHVSKSSRGFLISLCGVDKLVAADAERNQILLGVVSQSAAWVDVVYVEISKEPAALAAPSVPLQDLSAQSSVGFRLEPLPRAFWSERHHEAFPICSRKCCF